MHVIVTGGAGYIGSTVCTALLEHGIEPIIVDSLVLGDERFTRGRIFYKKDIADPDCLEVIKKAYPDVDTLIHCAARIVVDESVSNPALYYRENVFKSTVLFENCARFGVSNIIFSSSASVYGVSDKIAVDETTPCCPTSPYASTKLMMETVLADFSRAYGLRGLSLRYFNPIGADFKLRTGMYKENPTHLLGRLMSTLQSGETFTINGENWGTRDGTPIRDYIHVWDLALAHVRAVEFVRSSRMQDASHLVINLGTGQGTTVREFVEAFQEVAQRPLQFVIGERREGDIAGAYALADKAYELLGWKAELSITQGIRNALQWEEQNRQER